MVSMDQKSDAASMKYYRDVNKTNKIDTRILE